MGRPSGRRGRPSHPLRRGLRPQAKLRRLERMGLGHGLLRPVEAVQYEFAEEPEPDLSRHAQVLLPLPVDNVQVIAREVPGGDTAIIDLQRTPAASLSAQLPGIPAGPWVDVLSGRVQSLSPELTTLPAAPLSMALYVPASSPCAPGAKP